jgi:arabinogalactan oligomer / maltooligosaccharide transport system permease protein
MLPVVGRIAVLAISNGLAVFAAVALIGEKSWGYLAMLIIATVLINVAFATKRNIPLKYLAPGLVLMFLFQLYPVGYTVATSFTNYGTGNLVSQDKAIEEIIKNGVAITDESPQYGMQVLQNAAGDLRLLLEDPNTGERFIATTDSLTPLDESTVEQDADGRAVVEGYRRLRLGDIGAIQSQLDTFVAKTDKGEIRPVSASEAAVGSERFRYDSGKDAIVDLVDGTEYRPKSGVFTSPDGQTLEPGFKATIGTRNFTRILSEPTVRKPFIRIFIWNFVFAAGSVLATVAIGLLLAVTMNHPKVRGKAIYRQLLIIPYALPPFMMILVWSQGLFNPKYGYINETFGLEVAWLQNPWLARLAIILVNTWLGFPYMYLLCTGLLQSVPSDIYEAARVDGASGPQQFRKVTLPILLVGLSPMLISSFAFNFNNFLPIYLMTGGGPPIPGGDTGGQTDILATYTYKLAFASGKGTQYGLASAISIIIFAIVGLISAISFRQTKAFKEIS